MASILISFYLRFHSGQSFTTPFYQRNDCILELWVGRCTMINASQSTARVPSVLAIQLLKLLWNNTSMYLLDCLMALPISIDLGLGMKKG
ncbi:uncharacterized protein EV154DRAFT_534370 [Mucor mucedo]|uniref:uncharacterized protein n=1 Tax=Mucor mucedo TaxID=29922 RepID=UPI00221F7A4D|nr:uncharacterized protein EV154DRAFT_534370 [Mucor mucedo]KAI7864009.1 hypothetical protein EV154DRAFT_534370 [Mucor mucedo]